MAATRTSLPPVLNLTIRPHRGQAPILTSVAPIVAAIAGTGGGKTVIGMIWLLLQMARHPNSLWLVVEPTWQMVDRILLRSSSGRTGLLQLIHYFDPQAIYKRADRTIFSTMGTIYLASATHPESMEGAHVAGAWLDEAGQMRRLAYETAARRCSYRSGQLLITTTPYNRGWLFTDIFQRWQSDDKDFFVSQFSSIANPTYPKDVIERNRRTMSPARFKMFHEGAFERPEHMVLWAWDDSMLVDPFPIPSDWWQAGGLDLGFNHPTAAIWGTRDPDGIYYLHQEYRKPATLLSQHHTALAARSSNGSHPTAWYADPSAKQSIAELRRLGLPVVPANNDVTNGIDTVNTLMATGRLKVFKGLSHWIDEAESYAYEERDGIATERPVKLGDDLMDATRYLLHTTEKRQPMALYT